MSARAKIADGTIGALRDLKIEAFLSRAPMLTTLIERGRENAIRNSQSAEFMLLLSHDLVEQVCSVLERACRSSLLLLPREE